MALEGIETKCTQEDDIIATLYGHSTPRGFTVARPTPLGVGSRIRVLASRLGCQLRAALIATGEQSQPQPRTFAVSSGRYDSPERQVAIRTISALRGLGRV
ncbi:MAG: hypothetical protein HY329_14645 [Chloroflexi bacterium]|nr:hypothetical protein [Chloroflexota bacterium]